MDRAIKITVVEDEMIIGAKVSMYLSELGYEVTGIATRAEQALLSIQTNIPDIALLDIQLKGNMDGIELAQLLKQKYHIPVVFLTANTDDATFQRAKETRPYAFLSKPFNKLDLRRSLELTISLMQQRDTSIPNEGRQREEKLPPLSDRIFIYHEDKKVKLLFENILYVEAERNYCRIVTLEKEHLLTMPMKTLEDQLPLATFQRIHRSFIINLSHLDAVDESTVVVAGKALLLSKSYRKDLLLRIRTV
jgi:DNA-binding LytR/AlgR family response regulator